MGTNTIEATLHVMQYGEFRALLYVMYLAWFCFLKKNEREFFEKLDFKSSNLKRPRHVLPLTPLTALAPTFYLGLKYKRISNFLFHCINMFSIIIYP